MRYHWPCAPPKSEVILVLLREGIRITSYNEPHSVLTLFRPKIENRPQVKDVNSPLSKGSVFRAPLVMNRTV